MAVDTRNKRASCIGYDYPSGRVWPNPDGTLDEADRQHMAYKYALTVVASVSAVIAPRRFLTMLQALR